MNALQKKFIESTQSVFQFLETDHGFIRRPPQENTNPSQGGWVSIPYEKSNVSLQVVLKTLGIFVFIGKMENGKAPAFSNAWESETLEQSFSLGDLIEFRSQGSQHPELPAEEIDLNNCEKLLQECAALLRTVGADILQGDLSVLADIAIINKNQARRFLK